MNNYTELRDTSLKLLKLCRVEPNFPNCLALTIGIVVLGTPPKLT